MKNTMKGRNNMYELYTDGATSNNGYANAVGGWAYIIIKDGQIIYKEAGQETNPELATNQRMEMTAILRGCQKIEELDAFANVKVYSDSAYCMNCFKQHWWSAWVRNGWKNSKKQPVANQDLWEQIIPYFKKYPIYDFVKVKGHASNVFNNIVDALAVEAKQGKTVHKVYIDDGKQWIAAETLKWDGKEWVPIEVGVK